MLFSVVSSASLFSFDFVLLWILELLFIFFSDIFSLTKNPPVFSDCISLLVEHIAEVHNDVEVIAGLDSRGFIFGVLIALRLNIPFVPLRKKGKLPGETLRLPYSLEYGNVSIV